ncbi:MAG: AAA family ATPase [Hyphomicrobiaceae bacterium]
MQVQDSAVAPKLQASSVACGVQFSDIFPASGKICIAYGKAPTNVKFFTDLADFEAAMAELDQTTSVWFAPAGFDDKGVRKTENVIALKTFMFDADVGKPGCPTTKAEALERMEAVCRDTGLPMPNLIVDSGYGLHFYWALTAEILAARWRPLAEKLRDLLKKSDPILAKDTARVVDACGVLRFPGTTNKKNGGSKPVEQIGNGTRLYDLDEIEAALPVGSMPAASSSSAPSALTTPNALPVATATGSVLDAIPAHVQARMAGKPMKIVGRLMLDTAEISAAIPFAARDPKFAANERTGCFNFGTALAGSVHAGEISKEDAFALVLEHAAGDPEFGTGKRDVAGNEQLFEQALRHASRPAPNGNPITVASIIDAAEKHGLLAFTKAQIAAAVAPQRAPIPADEDDTDEALLIYPCAATFNPKQATPYIVKGLVLPGKTTYIYAPPSAAKSFFTVELVYAAAVEAMRHSAFGVAVSKARFFGRYIEPAAVLVVALEDRDSVVGQRSEALRRKYGDAGKFFAVLGVAGRLNRAEGGPGEAAIIRAARRQMRDTDAKQQVIVVDTLAQAMNGDDENSGMDAGAVRDRLERIAKATGAAMIVVHHTGKNPALGARGHSSLLGAADIMIRIDVLSPKDAEPVNGQRIRRVWIEKAKNEACGVPWTDFTLKVHDLGHDQDGEPVTSCTCEPLTAATAPAPQAAPMPKLKARAAGALTSLKDLMHEAPANGAGPGLRKVIDVDDWRNDVVGHAKGAIRETKTKQFKRAVVDLEQAGAVGLTDDKSKVWINAPWGQK